MIDDRPCIKYRGQRVLLERRNGRHLIVYPDGREETIPAGKEFLFDTTRGEWVLGSIDGHVEYVQEVANVLDQGCDEEKER